jgi:hypothetical protein
MASLCPGTTHRSRFRCRRLSFRCVSSGSHMFVFSSHTCPADSETSTATLTTPALYRRSLRWFGISACTATPEDLPPSLAQHGSCWRSSTSSSLPFRTHEGAENASCLLRRCIPLGVDSCSHLAVKVPRRDRWQPARGFATGQGASRAPSDLLRRVLGTLRTTNPAVR